MCEILIVFFIGFGISLYEFFDVIILCIKWCMSGEGSCYCLGCGICKSWENGGCCWWALGVVF